MTTKAVRILIVDHDPHNEDFIVGLSHKTLKSLKFQKHSHAMVKGKNDKKQALCSVYPAGCDDSKILMNRLVRYNLGLLLGDAVRMERTNITAHAAQVYLEPVGKQSEHNEEIMKDLVREYALKKPARTFCEGNSIIVRGGNSMHVLILKRVLPYSLGITNERTVFHLDPPQEQQESELISLKDTSYNDVGGQEAALVELRQFECLLRYPSLFKSLNAEPARVILSGPEGLGKLLMAKAFANETNAHFVLIDNEVLTSDNPDKENSIIHCNDIINEKFTEAMDFAPSVICLNDLQLMTPASFPTPLHRDNAISLIEAVYRLKNNPNVILIGITTDVNEVYHLILSLFLETRNTAQIAFSLPDLSRRIDILKLCTKNMNYKYPNSFYSIAALTEGYTAAKLKTLCEMAYGYCEEGARRQMDKNDKTDYSEFLAYKAGLSMEDFDDALCKMNEPEL